MTLMDWFQVIFVGIVAAVGLGGFVWAVMQKD
jgi:hypothetical protein